jgi:hypothetical protein
VKKYYNLTFYVHKTAFLEQHSDYQMLYNDSIAVAYKVLCKNSNKSDYTK